MATITLSRPVTVEDREIAALELDLEKLTGADLEEATGEFDMLAPGFVGVAASDMRFLACVAARACGMPAEVFRKLPASTYARACMAVQVFLLGTE